MGKKIQQTKNKGRRNKLSQRRVQRIKERAIWLETQRRRAWMTHQMIDEDLRDLHLNPIKKENNDGKEKEKENNK
jgi:hypothetical protein